MSDETRDDSTPVDHAPAAANGNAPEPDPAQEQPQVLGLTRPGGRRAFLQTLSRGAAVGATAVVGDACNKDSPTGPTSVATSTSTSVPTTTSTVRTTTTAAPTFTLAGVVTNRDGRPASGCRVFVVDGPNANRSSNTDGNGYYSIAGLVSGSFTLRTTCNNVFVADRPVTISSDTRLDFTVTITTSTPTTTSSVRSTTTTGGGGGPHYWYPN